MYYEQAGTLPFFRTDEGELQIMLITTTGKRRRWTTPKGTIESTDHSPLCAARRETLEEAGVKGILYPEQAGEFFYHKWGGLCRVQLFLLEITDILPLWEEATQRDRAFVTLSEAIKRVDVPEVQHLLQRLPELTARYQFAEAC
jgi:8-oxo-dGTP pyrophosphatase MutT (NUDIX family)